MSSTADTDRSLIEAVVEALLVPAEVDDSGPELETVTLPLAAAQFLAPFEGSDTAMKYLEKIRFYRFDSLTAFSVAKPGGLCTLLQTTNSDVG
jgi:hypothetical protein